PEAGRHRRDRRDAREHEGARRPGVAVARHRAVAQVSALLEMRGIEKRFGAVRALSGVDLSVAPGEVHALLGENGAGKSTLMKILSGVVPPDAGKLELGGASYRPEGPLSAEALGVAM